MDRNLKVCHACKCEEYHEMSAGAFSPTFYYINGLIEAELDGKVNTRNSLCSVHKEIYDKAFLEMERVPIEKEAVKVDKNAN